MKSFIRGACVCSLSVGLFACDSERSKPPVFGLMDAGLGDASDWFPPPDAGRVDAAKDARTDASKDPSGSSSCGLSRAETLFVVQSGVSPDEPIAVSVRNEGGSLSWVSYERRKVVYSLWLERAEAGGAGEVDGGEDDLGGGARAVAPTSRSDDQISPASAATATGSLVIWASQLQGLSTLQTRARLSDGTFVDPQQAWLPTSGEHAYHPVLAEGASGNLLAVWSIEPSSASSGSGMPGRSLALRADGVMSGTEHELSDYRSSAGRPALAPLGTGFVLAWVDARTHHVLMQLLDEAGAAVGSPQIVDGEANAKGTVSIATSDGGGAVAFDVLVARSRPEVRMRSFDARGVFARPEIVVPDSQATGLVPSIVALRGGYALAYRHRTTDGHALRLALVEPDGRSISSLDVDTLVDADLPVALGVSPDGQNLLLGWVDQDPDNATYGLERAWVRCD